MKSDETIRIKVCGPYNKPKYYPYMPESIFDALELAELKAAWNDEEGYVDVPKPLFEKMIEDYNEKEKFKNRAL